MAVYVVNKIENWHDGFVACRKEFINEYYKEYKNSYICSSNDATISKMRNRLDLYFAKIKKAYLKTEQRWYYFLNDLISIDEVLAGEKSSEVINDVGVSSALRTMPDLKTRHKSTSNGYSATIKSWIEENIVPENLKNLYKRCQTTFTLFELSRVESIVKLIESVIDLYILSNATYTSIISGLFDLNNWVISRITGVSNDTTNFTKLIWDSTRTVVSFNGTKSIFDAFYEHTDVGKLIKDNAFAFDTIRDVGNEVEKVIISLPISVLLRVPTSVVYGGLKGIERVEANWQNRDTSTLKGLLSGASGGVLDGVFYQIGIKGDNLAKSAVSKAIKSGVNVLLKKIGILGSKVLFEAGTAVVQDVGSITLQSIFTNDSIVDTNGNVIKFDSFSDKMKYFYEQAGGTKGIVVSAAIALGLSGLSDFVDIFGKSNIKTGDSDDINIRNKKYIIDEFKNDGKLPHSIFDYDISNDSKILISDSYEFYDIIDSKIQNYYKRYKALLDLERTNIPERIKAGEVVDRETGIKLSEVDDMLKYYESQIEKLSDITLSGNFAMTTKQTDVYQTINKILEMLDSKGYLNKDSLPNSSECVRIIQKAKAAGVIDDDVAKKIDSYKLRDVIDALGEKRKVDILNKFVNDEMVNKFDKQFSKYIPKDKIAEVSKANVFLTNEAFNTFYVKGNAKALSSPNNNYINIEYPIDELKVSVTHESIHLLSLDGEIRGIKLNESYTAINETFTEYLCKITMGADYPKRNFHGYHGMVTRLEMMVESGVISDEFVKQVYFSNNVDELKSIIDGKAMEKGYFEKLVNEFDKAYKTDSYDGLDQLISELIRRSNNG
ncbi:MAG: hypothetical protein U0M66_01760 [Bacilli bacterium]|nr:hypothetical protein [Bacilli bacterium]